MAIYSGPYTAAAADRVSRATLVAKARVRSVPYPIPPTAHVGVPRIANVAIAYATHDALPRQATDTTWWVQVQGTSSTLPAAPEIVDGQPTVPARAGVEKPDSDFVP